MKMLLLSYNFTLKTPHRYNPVACRYFHWLFAYFTRVQVQISYHECSQVGMTLLVILVEHCRSVRNSNLNTWRSTWSMCLEDRLKIINRWRLCHLIYQADLWWVCFTIFNYIFRKRKILPCPSHFLSAQYFYFISHIIFGLLK